MDEQLEKCEGLCQLEIGLRQCKQCGYAQQVVPQERIADFFFLCSCGQRSWIPNMPFNEPGKLSYGTLYRCPKP